MARVVGFIVLAFVIGLVTNLVLDRVLIGMFVTGGILLLGLVMLINRSE
jgi:hypothetical protein